MELLWKISELRTPFLDVVFQNVTLLGEELIPIGIICALYWCINKKLATQIGLTFITSGMLVQGLKVTFRVPRPWVLDPEFKPVESAVSAATGYSFPSGHTQSATSLFAPLALNAKSWKSCIIYIACFLSVGFSRMYLGCHTLQDVGTSIILTGLISLLVWKFQNSLIDEEKNTKLISSAILLVALFLCVYSLVLNRSGLIDSHYVADCFKMAGAGIGFSIGWYLERTHLKFVTKSENTTTKQLIFRFVIGLVVTAVIYVVPKLFFTGSALWKLIRYIIVIFWIIYGYPHIFTKFEK